MKILIIYFLILAAICVRDYFVPKTFDDFIAAGRRQGTFTVLISLMATMIGASATFGVAAKAETTGFPAVWWLAAGSAGLFAQAVFLSRRIRSTNASTLPDLAGKVIGPAGRKLVAAVIAVSWIGIIAAQFATVSLLFSIAAGRECGAAGVIFAAVAVTAYTLVGGQLSVLRTDILQFGVLVLGFAGASIYIFGGFAPHQQDFLRKAGGAVLTNGAFGLKDVLITFFTVGGAYFLGPDIISRNLVAKDGLTARRAAVLAGILLLFFSIIVTLTGMWTGVNLPGPGNPLFRLAGNALPLPLSALLSIGLISALLSSADTCLINSAAIVCHDIFGSKRVADVRISVAIIGCAAAILALRGNDIISLLFKAYSVYTPGIVCPLAVAVFARGRRGICKPIWYAAVFFGGISGFLGAVSGSFPEWLPSAGMGISLIFALASLRKDASSIPLCRLN